MSAFFSHLATRSVNQTTFFRPRLPSMFESESPPTQEVPNDAALGDFSRRPDIPAVSPSAQPESDQPPGIQNGPIALATGELAPQEQARVDRPGWEFAHNKADSTNATPSPASSANNAEKQPRRSGGLFLLPGFPVPAHSASEQSIGASERPFPKSNFRIPDLSPLLSSARPASDFIQKQSLPRDSNNMAVNVTIGRVEVRAHMSTPEHKQTAPARKVSLKDHLTPPSGGAS
jgi:hypothetical protein